jgi:hypothetical protein
MWPIRIIDKTVTSGPGSFEAHAHLEYTVPEAERESWSGRYLIEGIIEAHMCDDCGRVLLYAYPYED